MCGAPNLNAVLGASVLAWGCAGVSSESASSTGEVGSSSSSAGFAASSSSGLAADESSGPAPGDAEPSDRTSPRCSVAGVVGTCSTTGCLSFESEFSGLCGGPNPSRCCIPVQPACSRLGALGLCVPPDSCGEQFDAVGHFEFEGQFELCGGADVCCTDPLTRCDPEAMPLPNEGGVEAQWDDRCPDGMTLIDLPWTGPYCIDKYEASVVLVDDDGQVTQSWSPYQRPPQDNIRALSVALSVPQSFVSLSQATLACGTAGKYLCSGAEWEFACSGEDFWAFPYGPSYSPSACNEQRPTPPMVEYFGSEAAWVWQQTDHPCLSQLPESLHRTGDDTACTTPSAVFDLVGNVGEWTASGRLVGGSFSDPLSAAPSCYSSLSILDTELPHYAAGFRCCAEAM